MRSHRRRQWKRPPVPDHQPTGGHRQFRALARAVWTVAAPKDHSLGFACQTQRIDIHLRIDRDGDRRRALRCRPWPVLAYVPAKSRMRSDPRLDLRRSSVVDRASCEFCAAALQTSICWDALAPSFLSCRVTVRTEKPVTSAMLTLKAGSNLPVCRYSMVPSQAQTVYESPLGLVRRALLVTQHDGVGERQPG